ncbi:unnamed protein product [Alopecurus aequalis]
MVCLRRLSTCAWTMWAQCAKRWEALHMCMCCQVSEMKEGEVFRVALLLSYLSLVTRGNCIRSINKGENTSHIVTCQHINKTIQMEGGDIFDCIDVNQQPALNHLLLKDHKIQMEPSSLPIGMDIKSLSSHVLSQAQPPIVSCPRGTIPIIRNNIKDHVASKSINEVVGRDKQQEGVGIKYLHDDIYGTGAIFNVYEPKVKNNSMDFSASGIEIYNGPDLAEAIFAGYAVSPSLSGDSFARFHVAWDPRTKNWWVILGEENTPIGYWPSSLFTYLKDKGDSAFLGGHVSGPNASIDSPQIGSGHFASEGFGKSAFIKHIQIVDKNNKFVNPNETKAFTGSTNISKFTTDGYEVTKDGMRAYYGGPGDFV